MDQGNACSVRLRCLFFEASGFAGDATKQSAPYAVYRNDKPAKLKAARKAEFQL